MTTDCPRIGLERCGVDVSCGQCCGDPGDCQDALELSARSALDLPYFDIDGNEGTLGEVYSA